jgi:acyl-CoA carboxylase epsilon subunit
VNDNEGERPALRVVRGGDPTPEETAAMVAAVMTLVRTQQQTAAARRSAWADRASGLRRPLARGPGAWRRSARGS